MNIDTIVDPPRNPRRIREDWELERVKDRVALELVNAIRDLEAQLARLHFDLDNLTHEVGDRLDDK